MSNKEVKKSKKGYIKYILLLWMLFLVGIASIVIFINQIPNGIVGELPSFEELENPTNALASEVYTADGILLGKYFIENRSNATYEDISPNLINALIATEDIRFEDHSGIDLQGLSAAIVSTLRGNKRGASTVTQQLAKNLFHRRDAGIIAVLKQKVLEWYIAVELEKRYTKQEIIAMYFNTVPFGQNAFGIKSATKTFFSTTPDSVNIQEAATLVGMLKATTYFNPIRNPENALKRRNVVLKQMKKYKKIPSEVADSIIQLPIEVKYNSSDHNDGIAPYFRKILRLELSKWARNNVKVDGTNYNIYKDGLKFYTTIDSRMQRYAEEAVKKHMETLQDTFYYHWKGRVPWAEVPEVITRAYKRSHRYISLKRAGLPEDSIKAIFDIPVKMTVFSWKGEIDTTMSPMDSIKYYRYFLHTGFMAMDPTNGHIKAWVGGINHKYFKYDHVNITAKRQVGSTFKPFVYAVAIDNGLSPCREFPNVPETFEKYDNWTAENAGHDDYGNMLTVQQGLAGSVNTITAKIMKEFGPENGQNVITLAKAMGIKSEIPPVPSICLGVTDISVYEMIGAYSTFANKGFASTPMYITKIEDKNGNLIQNFASEKKEALREETSYAMLQMMQKVTARGGTGYRLRFWYNFTGQIAAKTATTQNHSDGWFIGVIPKLVAGAWVGADDRAVHFRSINLGQGAFLSLPIWGEFMTKVYADSTIGITQDDEFELPEDPNAIELNCDKYKSHTRPEETPEDLNSPWD